MNWGNRIIVAYIMFAGLVFSLVVICMGQDISLVDTNYYKQEIAYQEQMDRLQNFKDLDQVPTTSYNRPAAQIVITFPDMLRDGLDSGSVHFYRPSKAALDLKLPLSLNAKGQEVISTKEMNSGLWKIRLSWIFNDQEYYHEKIVVI